MCVVGRVTSLGRDCVDDVVGTMLFGESESSERSD